MSNDRKRLAGCWLGNLVVLGILVGGSSPVWAVDCTPADITLSSQAQVDDFQLNHGPGCDTITGNLTISGSDIDDLTPLAGLTTGAPSSFIYVESNPVLPSLSGLDQLSEVFWLDIRANDLLTDLSGLESLVTVTGQLDIQINPSLISLTGLDNLDSVSGGILVFGNAVLESLDALHSVTTIGTSLSVVENPALLSLDGLSGLQSVGGLLIWNNDLLENLSGLSSLTGFSGGLNIRGNLNLQNLTGLPAITELSGLVIQDNASLQSIDSLVGLAVIGNGMPRTWIGDNFSLETLDGLDDLISLDVDLEISNNPALEDCSSLDRLLDDRDDALPGPGPGAAGIPDVNGDLVLSDNLPGCNSLGEILAIFHDRFEML